MWAHGAAQRDLLEAGDSEEGLNAAAAIGDDTLAKKAGAEVVPESFTHMGHPAQRVRWFKRGFERGQVLSSTATPWGRCDIHSVRIQYPSENTDSRFTARGVSKVQEPQTQRTVT